MVFNMLQARMWGVRVMVFNMLQARMWGVRAMVFNMLQARMWGVRAMVFNVSFNNISVISWRSVLLLGKTGENHRPAASH